ncbi:MFS transporter [Brachybacterium sp. AOP25-B2-12]|uniref:MFS transporter n=1 Tax=Brachybacterium sp. AOP25-B2-12 TaxID=3457710 RepID=UPI0040348E1B
MTAEIDEHPLPGDRTPSPATTAPARSRVGAVIALAGGIAMLVPAEFFPARVLPHLARDLRVTEGTAGLAVAVTALAGALTAPAIASVLPRADRRRVLLGLLVLALLSNIAVALTPSFAVLLAGRFVLGIAIAGYWSFAFVAGTHALPGRPALVSTALASGTSVATIVGVPLASFLGDVVGWRAVFWIAAALTALSLIAVARLLPSVPAQPGAGLAMMRTALTNRRLVAGILLVAVVAFANFTAYPYIRLVIDAVAPSSAPLLLLGWGVAGLVGNLLAGRLAGRLRLAVALGPAVLGIALGVLTVSDGVLPLVLAVLAWGLGFNMVPVSTQLWVTSVDPARAESALGLQVTAFQVAIMVGSVTGGALVDHTGVGAALLLGAVAAIVGAIGFGALRAPSAS